MTGFAVKPTRQRKSFKKKLLLVLFGLLLGCLMSEILLRIIGYSYPLFYTTDYYCGFALQPGAEGQYQREGGSYVRINSDGLRDREHARPKPADTIRIAVVGDSFAEALQVSIEEGFVSVLQRQMENCQALGGKSVEIINFGVSGYGTAQELITLRRKVWEYSPDIVLLTFTTNNDIRDNARVLKKTDEVPYFVWRDGTLVEDDSFRLTKTFRWRSSALNRAGRWFYDRLRFVQLIHYAQFVVKVRLAEKRNQERAGASDQHPATTSKDISLENMIYLEPHDETWTDAWRVTEALVEQVRDEVRQRGAKFVLVTTSNAIQVHPDPAVRQNFMTHIGVSTVFYPNLRLKDFAQRQQIDFLDLAEPMQTYADQHRVFLHGFRSDIGNGHWNAAGHRLAAELIAQRLCGNK